MHIHPGRRSSTPLKAEGSKKNHGLALITVLGVLALALVLVVANLSQSQAEWLGSRAFSTRSSCKNLGDTAVSLVVAQIRAATEDLGSKETWASQPGMIRRFGTGGNSPDGRAPLKQAFKLYSSPNMVEGAAFDPDGEIPPADWNTRPHHFTDLNAPILKDLDFDGTRESPMFPIADPRSASPSADSPTPVAGFDFETTLNGTIKSGDANARLPMPARWIYVLKDGTLGTLNDADTFVGERTPDAQNPIVGRIAFWADDETCKANVNTASEGVYWSPPFGYTVTERSNDGWINHYPNPPYGYAVSIPVRNEFSRLPGHPANTSLSPVLGSYLPVEKNPQNVTDPEFAAQLKRYYDLIPRVVDGGSQGGTIATGDGKNVNKLLEPDGERLFASVDETLFSMTKSTSGNQRALSDSALTPAAIQRSGFFLTSQSRAPEVSLFNKPRISLWPIMREETWRSTIDSLIAHCATIADHPFYWQRYSPWISYENPGSAQVVNQEVTAVPRNLEIFEFLKKQTSMSAPGFSGNNFADKLGADHPQVLVEMLDYIRSSVNTVPNGLPPGYWYTAARGGWRGANAAAPGEGSVVPLQIDSDGVSAKGFGRMTTVTEAALVLHPAPDPNPDPNNPPPPPQQGKAKWVRAVFMLEPFSPSIGLPSWGPNVRYIVKGLDSFKINNKTLDFKPEIPIVGEVPVGYFDGLAHNNVAFIGFYQLFRRYRNGPNSSSNEGRTLGSDERQNYTLYGEATIEIPDSADTLSFTGGTVTIELRSAHEPAPGTVLQTIRMRFPGAASWPVPHIDGDTNMIDFNNRMAGGGNMNSYKMRIIQKGDVVRSVEVSPTGPAGGDLRLISGRYDVSEDYFAPHPRYFESDYASGRFAHGLRNDRHTYQGQIGWRNQNSGTEGAPFNQSYLIGSWWTNWDWMPSTWSTAGALIPDTVHFRDHSPAVARGINGALRRDGKLGDWETGHGITPDGCYIRKAHEGSLVSGKGDAGYFVHLQGNEGGDWRAGIDWRANFYPNRQIASPVQLGALSTGVQRQRPFETLLFNPVPNGRTTPTTGEPDANDHPGFSFPRDHLLLDQFWMPMVEPYALSEPLSTAGKINLNYDILPFRYIKRRTALHCLFDKARVTAIPTGAVIGFLGSWSYKQSAPCNGEFRYAIDLDPDTGTLRGFEDRFDDGDIFRSASELCEIPFVPKQRPLPPGNTRGRFLPVPDPTYENVIAWWDNFKLTGDNCREAPYDHIYPRVTTKSNSYRVHYTVQSLSKARSSDPSKWDPARDIVTGEQRGSSLVERFIDPTDPTLPDFMTTDEAVDGYYQFRITQDRRVD